MTRTGVGTVVWFLALCIVKRVSATDCSTLVSNNVLDVIAGTECTVGADLVIPNVVVTVYGTMKITVPIAMITVTDLEIKAGGKVTADAVSDHGVGAGNSLGSGGKLIHAIDKKVHNHCLLLHVCL